MKIYEAPHMKIYEAPHMNFGEAARRAVPGSTRSAGQQENKKRKQENLSFTI